jgi:single-stranded DNA-binding protein
MGYQLQQDSWLGNKGSESALTFVRPVPCLPSITMMKKRKKLKMQKKKIEEEDAAAAAADNNEDQEEEQTYDYHTFKKNKNRQEHQTS